MTGLVSDEYFVLCTLFCLTIVEWEHLVHCQQQHTAYFNNIGDLPSYPSRRLFDIHLVPPPLPLLQ